MGKQVENLRAELLKIGIRTDQDLRDAIASLPPLKLHIMTGDIKNTDTRSRSKRSEAKQEEKA